MATRKTITRAEPTLSTVDFRWELEPADRQHEVFTRWADRTRDLASSVERRKRNLLYASMYSNLPMLGFGSNQYTRSISNAGIISLNVTQNAIDSLVSKVCKNDPRPMFTTNEADFELREKAENADRYIDGMFMNDGYYETTHPGAVLDCAIYGLGMAKNHVVDGKAIVERTFCHELIVDERQCMYGDPPRIGQRKYYDKQVLFDLYRKDADKEWTKRLEDAIDKGGPENDPDFDDFDRDESSEQIMVYEGYAMRTARSKGHRLLCIRGMTLETSEWRFDSPFTMLRPMVQMAGLYGIGCAEKIIGIQREINRIVKDIQMSMHLIAKPHWMVEASSNVLAQHLNNDIATIIKYSGAVPPQVYTPEAMSGDVYAHLQFLYKTAYEILGVSQLSAQSQKPAGIDSAVGMRTYLNVETERFSQFVKATEAFAAKNARKTATNLGRTKPGPTLSRKGDVGHELLTWEPMDFENVRVSVYPTSKLPDTPAGKREYALELAQYGVAKPDDIFEMLEWGDTEAFAKRRLAGRRNVERDIAKMRRGIRVVRDAIGNHAMAFQMASDAYEEAKLDGLPPARLAIIRNYVKACERFLAKKAPPAPPMGGPPMDPALGPPPGQEPIPGAPGEPPPPLPNAPMAPPEVAV